MAREYMDAVSGELETPFGTMQYSITQGDHVYLAAGGSDRLPPLTINRVPYYVSLHLFLQPDGTWRYRDYHELYMSRKDSTLKEASQAARGAAYEGIRPAWEESIAGSPDLLAEAERRFLNNEIGKAEEDLEKAHDKVRELEEARAALLRREAALG